MKKWLLVGIALVLLSACGSGTFQVPKQEYQSRVQVLGVLPLLVDQSSRLDYPQKDILFDMLARSAQDKHQTLSAQLQEEKGYFDVRTLAANPQLTAMSLLSGGKTTDDFGRPTGYRFDAATVAELAEQNVVDALLVVVLSGEKITQTRRSRTMLESLKTEYSDIIATAAVVERGGQVLWQMNGKDSFQFLALQYPDFDEAHFNRTDRVRVKDISLSGLERALEEKAKKSDDLPKVYKELFQEIVSSISPGLLDSLR